MSQEVFISYRSSERAAIEQLVAAIEQAGDFHVWYDQEIIGGQSWWEEILRALENADIVVLALSPAYMASEACQLEMDYALRLGKAILPVSIDPALVVQNLGAQLQSRQIITFPADDTQQLVMALNAARPGVTSANVQRPEAPISPLAEIRDLINAPGELPTATQQRIVDALRWHLRRQPEDSTAVIALLNHLDEKPEIARQVADEIANLVANSTPSLAEAGRGLPQRGLVIAAALIIIAILAALVLVPTLNTPAVDTTPTISTDTSQQIVNTPLPVQTGPFDVTLIYGARDSFTVLINDESHLHELALETPILVETITDSFQAFAVTGFVAEAGVCLRYIREGTQPALPRGCNAGATYEQELPDVDVFWFDDRRNQYLDIAFKQSGELIGLCPHAGGSGRCNFESSG